MDPVSGLSWNMSRAKVQSWFTKVNHKSEDQHFTVLLGKVMLHLVEFLGWHHRGREVTFGGH